MQRELHKLLAYYDNDEPLLKAAPVKNYLVLGVGHSSRQEWSADPRQWKTPLGLAVLGAKAMLCIVWYEHPAAQAEIGYDRGCLGPAGAEGAADAKGER